MPGGGEDPWRPGERVLLPQDCPSSFLFLSPVSTAATSSISYTPLCPACFHEGQLRKRRRGSLPVRSPWRSVPPARLLARLSVPGGGDGWAWPTSGALRRALCRRRAPARYARPSSLPPSCAKCRLFVFGSDPATSAPDYSAGII